MKSSKVMKQIFVLVMALLLAVPSATAQSYGWQDGKFSMFIHFGLYSELGGVWNGQPVTKGYSEQIQSHGGIQSDLYAEVASRFNPVEFDADGIVALAKKAGMHSIVITSKHHDGFCLFKTSTTEYNSVDATPCHRDFIAELSEACRKGGIRFGMYFSIIDWNEPYGAPITTHNADPVTPEHHQFNLRQVEELVTNYGPVSELWFDMGSNTPQQSKELYELVKKYQPGCMVSGRLGNGYYDFAVMSDNFYPDESLQVLWQSCASMFNETWGYRSWQKRGDVHAKAMEKLRSLIRVTAAGGNLLLNIGPTGTGAVVPFERQVLEEIGSWLAVNGDAIYCTEASPFRTPFEWGCVTRKGNVLNLILSGTAPEGGVISLPMPGCRVKAVEGPAKVSARSGVVTVIPGADAYSDDIKVVRITFDKPVLPVSTVAPGARVADCSYHCHDYYTNYRSAVSYQWQYDAVKINGIDIEFTSQEIGRKAILEVDGAEYPVTLEGTVTDPVSFRAPGSSGPSYATSGKTTFDASGIPERGFDKLEWHGTGEKVSVRGVPTLYMKQTFESPLDQKVILDVAAGNGLEVYVNGKSIAKHLNPYRCGYREEKVVADFVKGGNEVLVRSYNRFEKTAEALLRISPDQRTYTQTVALPETLKKGSHVVILRPADPETVHQDCELHNVRLTIR